jgi:CoA-dependent NAD(P)H sulfur oxidoreductase
LVVRDIRKFRENGINVLTGHRATQIDRANQKVVGTTSSGQSFEYPYDRLLIATGAAANKPDAPGYDLPQVDVIKSLEDGRRIKNLLKQGKVKRAVIIGMGYIALEMCEALTRLGIMVDMLKPGPIFLPWLKEEMAQAVRAEIDSNNVGVYTGHTIERIEKSGRGLQVICADTILTADLVIIGIGITPNSRIAADAGLALSINQSIAVDRNLRTSDPNIYAAGDCADAYHIVTGVKTWIPLALRANRAGWAVADNVCGKEAALDGVAGTGVFRVFDFEVARTGLTLAEAARSGFEPLESMITSRSRAHGHPGSTTIWVNMVGDRKSGRLLGVQMVGKEGVAHRINGPAVALHKHMTVEHYCQADLAYAPPFGPTWDPTLTAATQLLKKLQSS